MYIGNYLCVNNDMCVVNYMFVGNYMYVGYYICFDNYQVNISVANFSVYITTIPIFNVASQTQHIKYSILTSSFFRNATQLILVVCYRLFETTFHSRLQYSNSTLED